MTIAARIPQSHPEDSGEVAEALEVASSLWRTGNRRDAVRWVRRAAHAADEAGDSLRMTELARAGADLEESLSAAPSVHSSAPPVAALPRPAPSVPPPPESSTRVRSKVAPPPLPAATRRSPPVSKVAPERRVRFRVSIKRSVLDATLLVVRRLEDGGALPAGAREGWVEMSEPAAVGAPHASGKKSP